MRGAAMKIGQLVSMDAGRRCCSAEACRDPRPPAFGTPISCPPRQLKEVLNANWGKDWLGAFERFDVRPHFAAASIGQVHRARLKDGRDLAVKVQYPVVARSIDSDVANVGALLRLRASCRRASTPHPTSTRPRATRRGNRLSP